MKKILLFLTCALASAVSAVQAEPFSWPQDEKMAVSLSYDDTLNSQLDNAIPTLNQYNLKGSFYLLLSTPVITERLGEWRAAAEAGHELGNHTIYHGCSKSQPDRDWVKPYNDIDKRTREQMRDEILVANAFLHSIDGQTERTFTPPCGDVETSDGNYLEAIDDLFVGIKGYTPGQPQDFSLVVLPNGHSGDELIAAVESAAQKHKLLNIIFHGIGGDHLSVSAEAHEKLVEYLADNRDIYWTDTYRNIVKHTAGK